MDGSPGSDRPNIEVPVYLDNQATTPLDPRVLDAMLPWMRERFGNPHSAYHVRGWDARQAVEQARRSVAALIGARADEIVFTSGATEANNLALRGLAGPEAARPRRLVTSAVEHSCILAVVRALAREGAETVELPVDDAGRIDMEALDRAVTPDTDLVSIMAANNEIGTLQPLADIARLCAARGVPFHTDAAQAAGKVPLDVGRMAAEGAPIGLMSLSAHKLYGPMGIGALYVRRDLGDRLRPLMLGGGQEQGLRAGTVPTPLCVGFGAAAAIARDEAEAETRRLTALRDRMLAGLAAGIPTLRLNGAASDRLPGNLNVSVPGVAAQDLIAEADGLALSTGAACGSASSEPSHVLRAIGLTDAMANASIRIGLGRFTTAAEVDYAVESLTRAAASLRPPAAAPLASAPA